jgi:hypothetical protein
MALAQGAGLIPAVIGMLEPAACAGATTSGPTMNSAITLRMTRTWGTAEIMRALLRTRDRPPA